MTCFVNARDFGVLADNLNDDGPALANAATYAASIGAELLLPWGTIRILTGFAAPTGSRWRGSANAGTIIRLDPSASFVSGGGVEATILFNGLSNVSLTNILFLGPGESSAAHGSGGGQAYTYTRVVFVGTSFVRIQDCIFVSFGKLTTPTIYAHGLLFFGGANIQIARCRFETTSGDGLAFSNGANQVSVHDCTFINNQDSCIVGTIGCYNLDFSNNYCEKPTGDNVEPNIVMDRCWGWTVGHNRIRNGAQGVRVARYGDTSELNRDFTIVANVIEGCSSGISVESASTVQGSFTSTGGTRWCVVGNTVSSANNGIVIANSETGIVSGNTVDGDDHGVIVIGYSGTTGNIALSGNAARGGNYGIRELSAGGSMIPNSISGNVVYGGSSVAPYQLIPGTVTAANL